MLFQAAMEQSALRLGSLGGQGHKPYDIFFPGVMAVALLGLGSGRVPCRWNTVSGGGEHGSCIEKSVRIDRARVMTFVSDDPNTGTA